MKKSRKMDGNELEEERFQPGRPLHERVADEAMAGRGGDEQAAERLKGDQVHDRGDQKTRH